MELIQHAHTLDTRPMGTTDERFHSIQNTLVPILDLRVGRRH